MRIPRPTNLPSPARLVAHRSINSRANRRDTGESPGRDEDASNENGRSVKKSGTRSVRDGPAIFVIHAAGTRLYCETRINADRQSVSRVPAGISEYNRRNKPTLTELQKSYVKVIGSGAPGVQRSTIPPPSRSVFVFVVFHSHAREDRENGSREPERTGVISSDVR